MYMSGNEFNAIRISLASPDQIKTWSYGEVTKPETINYRTLRPEKDGLFCERIFGPIKDWECYCGKYKKIRYKGVVCDRCGVEVARAKVRRERMGHIQLAAPLTHIWFSKGTPSRIGLLLDLSPRNLERVVYFSQYLVTSVNDSLKESAIKNIELIKTEKLSENDKNANLAILDLLESEKIQLDPDEPIDTSVDNEQFFSDLPKKTQNKINKTRKEFQEKRFELEGEFKDQLDEINDLRIGQLLTESRYRILKNNAPGVFQAGMGAESIYQILSEINLDSMKDKFLDELKSTSGQRRKKAIKTLRVVESFRKSGNKPEWMVMTVLPVLPPELRPMVQLDGGRFATSDLNDLYRRVINRNNRLRRLIDLQAPEIIIRNEKRMLQESVDALIDNGRRGQAVSGSHNHKLKSLSDLLRGKQGRFRQNLLGKRVDYSGRSVITVGPNLKLDECGIPRKMALELYKPFVMNRLVMNGHAHNIKSAKRMAERARPEIWDILEEVVKERPVLLNRAPTLHRLGIQAFKPMLIEGGAIQVHPLVCTAFNADFDGDQMAVHVPLTKEAVLEAYKIMLSSQNMLSPSSGEPIVAPTLDMVMGCYYMTMIKESAKGTDKIFADFSDAEVAYNLGEIDLQANIQIQSSPAGKNIHTTAGRILFNQILPEELGFYNTEIDKPVLKDITSACSETLGQERTPEILDSIKDIGFKYASKSGITIAINDVIVSEEKGAIIKEAEDNIQALEEQFMDGLITDLEKYQNAVKIWTEASDKLTGVIENSLHDYSGIYLMATSGAKGNIAQIKQMAGMRGLMSDPKGRIIDRPIKSNFREGLTVLEYFISTHGARKGLADTALRTADSGYLTRRLVDVAQEITISEEDCQTNTSISIQKDTEESLESTFTETLYSRVPTEPIVDNNTGEIIVDKYELIDNQKLKTLSKADVSFASVRSPLTCESKRGVCQICYGASLGDSKLANIGEAVGIIAAQSIGEPGTQLTMRTFHTGGIAGTDITSGLPRVEELFEARSPKGQAILSEIDGIAKITETNEGRFITVSSTEKYVDEYPVNKNLDISVKSGEKITIGSPIAKPVSSDTGISPILARVNGIVTASKRKVKISWEEEEIREYTIPAASYITIKDNSSVKSGEALTSGPKNPQQILSIQGPEEVQQYMLQEVQKVYKSQGVSIHDKHIEVIIRQMLRKVRVESIGDSDLLPGELIDKNSYEDINASMFSQNKEPSSATPVLLGITRASLNMESFLAAASFQETTRVLAEASVKGGIDDLQGLKENVIIGRLIPAKEEIVKEAAAMKQPSLEMISPFPDEPSESNIESIVQSLENEESNIEDLVETLQEETNNQDFSGDEDQEEPNFEEFVQDLEKEEPDL